MRFTAITAVNSRGWVDSSFADVVLTANNFHKVMGEFGFLFEEEDAEMYESQEDSYARKDSVEEALSSEGSIFAYPNGSGDSGDLDKYNKHLNSFKEAVKGRKGYIMVNDEDEGSAIYVFDDIVSETDIQLLLMNASPVLQNLAKEIIEERKGVEG